MGMLERSWCLSPICLLWFAVWGGGVCGVCVCVCVCVLIPSGGCGFQFAVRVYMCLLIPSGDIFRVCGVCVYMC